MKTACRKAVEALVYAVCTSRLTCARRSAEVRGELLFPMRRCRHFAALVLPEEDGNAEAERRW